MLTACGWVSDMNGMKAMKVAIDFIISLRRFINKTLIIRRRFKASKFEFYI